VSSIVQRLDVASVRTDGALRPSSMDGRNFFLDGRSSSVQGRYVQTSAPSVHLDGRSVVWTERFRARESGSVRPSSMDGRSARLDGALPRPRIGLRPSIVHPLRPDGALRPSGRTEPLRPSGWTDGAAGRTDGAVRPFQNGRSHPNPAPSKSARTSNGRSVQISSVQTVAPSVQRTLRPNRLRPKRRSVRPLDGRPSPPPPVVTIQLFNYPSPCVLAPARIDL